MDNEKKSFLLDKTIYFKTTKIVKVNDIYKVSSFQVLCYWLLLYTKSVAIGWQNTINPSLKNIRLQRCEVLIKEI